MLLALSRPNLKELFLFPYLIYREKLLFYVAGRTLCFLIRLESIIIVLDRWIKINVRFKFYYREKKNHLTHAGPDIDYGQGPIKPTVGPGPDVHFGPYSKSSQKFEKSLMN